MSRRFHPPSGGGRAAIAADNPASRVDPGRFNARLRSALLPDMAPKRRARSEDRDELERRPRRRERGVGERLRSREDTFEDGVADRRRRRRWRLRDRPRGSLHESPSSCAGLALVPPVDPAVAAATRAFDTLSSSERRTRTRCLWCLLLLSTSTTLTSGALSWSRTGACANAGGGGAGKAPAQESKGGAASDSPTAGQTGTSLKVSTSRGGMPEQDPPAAAPRERAPRPTSNTPGG